MSAQPTIFVSPKHPHDEEPVLDKEGRCMVCSVMVLYDEMRDWLAGHRSWTNLGPNEPYTPAVIAVMDAQEVVKRAAAIPALLALVAAGLPTP